MRAAERGMSLLETSLALSLVAGFSAGLFMLSRSQQQTASAVLDEFKGPRQGMQALSIIGQELANARFPLVSAGTDSVRFTPVSGGGTRLIGLAGGLAQDPRYRPLIFDPGTGASPLNSERLIQNHNHERGTIMTRAMVPTTGPVDLFTYFDVNGAIVPQAAIVANPAASLPQIRRIEIFLVLRPKLDSPPRYMRTSVTLRN